LITTDQSTKYCSVADLCMFKPHFQPSHRRGLSPAVRAFVGHMKKAAAAGKLWMDDPISKVSPSPLHPRYSSKRSLRKK
jgi:hypothetical protein